MDLLENIKIAAQEHYDLCDFDNSNNKESFMIGATSLQARNYWYNEFKHEQLVERNKINEMLIDLRNQPLKPNECFHGKSDYQSFLDEQNELWQKQVIEPGYKEQRQYQQYINDNPDRPISFDNWKYMVEHYQLDISNDRHPLTRKEAELFGLEVISETDMGVKRVRLPRNIGIIGHVDHGVSALICGVKSSRMDNLSEMDNKHRSDNSKLILVGSDHPAIIEANKHPFVDIPELPIKSIVPIHDIYPEDKVKWNERYDKPWDIKKEKKENHKRNNKKRR